MSCETETIIVTKKVTYYVDATMSTINRFGPLCSRESAEALLRVLSSRTDVSKAEIITVLEEV